MTRRPNGPQPHRMISEEGPYGMALDAAWAANEAWDTIHTSPDTIAELEAIKERHLPGITVDDSTIENLKHEHELAEKEFPEYVVVAGSLLRQPKSTRRGQGAKSVEQDNDGNEIFGINPRLQYYLNRPVGDLLDEQAATEDERQIATQLERTLRRNKIFETRAMLLRGLDHEDGITDIRTIGEKQIDFTRNVVKKLDPEFEWSEAPDGTRAAHLYTSLRSVPADILRYQEGRHKLGLDFGDFTITQVSNMSVSAAKGVIKRGNYTPAQLTELASALKNAATVFKNEFAAERRSIIENHTAPKPASTKKRR